MKITESIHFKDFKKKKIDKKIKNLLDKILKKDSAVLDSLKQSYNSSYKKNIIIKLKKYPMINIIGMGGSILGSRAIFNFFKKKIKDKFNFIDYFDFTKQNINKKKQLNIVISKSGSTLETVSNSNLLIKNHNKNIFITENKKSYLTDLAKKLKSEIIHHNNFIGGRYSILSEVGMLPAELMGLKPNKFRRLNFLIKNKKFMSSLVQNVSNTLNLINKQKSNSIILNYDENSKDLFFWYQQLIAESLGKKGKGILPVISNIPRDNHSLMQFYLDGVKNSFYTFFFIKDNFSKKINSKEILKSHYYLKNRTLNDIKMSQFRATEKIFKKKNIPFRSFLLDKRDEKTLGELFIFFILETILLGRAMNLNPYDQPAVELIKTETKKYLINF